MNILWKKKLNTWIGYNTVYPLYSLYSFKFTKSFLPVCKFRPVASPKFRGVLLGVIVFNVSIAIGLIRDRNVSFRTIWCKLVHWQNFGGFIRTPRIPLATGLLQKVWAKIVWYFFSRSPTLLKCVTANMCTCRNSPNWISPLKLISRNYVASIVDPMFANNNYCGYIMFITYSSHEINW